MCYLCREDLTEVGYNHFCPHLHAVPGTPCDRCDKCFLYHTEDEDKVAKAAGRRAAEEWDQRKEKEKKDRGMSFRFISGIDSDTERKLQLF